jgi:hypothetical protein
MISNDVLRRIKTGVWLREPASVTLAYAKSSIRDDAFRRERRSRMVTAKKAALAREDWSAVQRLARECSSFDKLRMSGDASAHPSTSSG